MKKRMGDWRMSTLEQARTRGARAKRMKETEMCRLCGRITLHNRWVGSFSRAPLASSAWGFCSRDCAQALAVQVVVTGEWPDVPPGYFDALPEVVTGAP